MMQFERGSKNDVSAPCQFNEFFAAAAEEFGMVLCAPEMIVS
jgi:hypothetical protein